MVTMIAVVTGLGAEAQLDDGRTRTCGKPQQQRQHLCSSGSGSTCGLPLGLGLL